MKQTRKAFLRTLIERRIDNPPSEEEDLRSMFYDLVPEIETWARKRGIDLKKFDETHTQTFARRVYKDLSAVISEMVLNHETTYEALRLIEAERKMREDFFPDFDFELWFEKNGLMNVLRPVRYGIRTSLVSCKGFQSTNVLEKSTKRIAEGHIRRVFIISDHDPSGRDIARDLEERAYRIGLNVNVKRIGIEPDDVPDDRKTIQLKEINWKDSRAQGFVDEWGEDCYEVSAVPKDRLREIILQRLKDEGVDFSGLPDLRLDDNRNRLADKITEKLLEDVTERVQEFCYDLIVEKDERTLSLTELEDAIAKGQDPLPLDDCKPLRKEVTEEAREEFGLHSED